MPLGWERINARTTSPNKNIVFIKPRAGKDEAKSKAFLERIAAQCLPIMNTNYLSVVSLEEFPPNREFWGRNFNNGEVIQLVLKSPGTESWLPFKFVQMVMMHELAHCKQMNHSGAFWKLRNTLAEEMRGLWSQGYTGDGLWGRGTLLEDGELAPEELPQGESLPANLCGGTFRSRNKKRKAKPKITYKEQKERRILKKFGQNGVALGEDEDTRLKLENGKSTASKPRVAGSKRGRELRAAAALARFDLKEVPQIKDEDLVTDSEAESDDEVKIKLEPTDALDLDGTKLLDNDGRGLVKVCEDEDEGDDAKNELSELRSFGKTSLKPVVENMSTQPSSSKAVASKVKLTGKHLQASGSIKPVHNPAQRPKPSEPEPTPQSDRTHGSLRKPRNLAGNVYQPVDRPLPKSTSKCSCCSFENDLIALTCLVCANVLRPQSVVGSWKCKSEACKKSQYVNAGDAGLCGVCGSRP